MNITSDFLQTVLKASVCLFMLSSTPTLIASGDEFTDLDAEEAVKADSIESSRRVKLPSYEMKTVKGVIYDAATRAPMSGVRIQALGDRRYTAMTEENGTYTISVPVFTTSLYVNVPEYNSIQLAVKGEQGNDAYLQTNHFKSFFEDATQITMDRAVILKETSSISVENEIENHLGGDVRTINRGGLPGQGAMMLIRGINSLKTNAQPLVLIDGVIIDLQEGRKTIHDGFYNNLLAVIDVEDIEQVKVLKNGTAIYGARGANGVILIDTKRGKSMATRINFRTFAGVETQPKKIGMMNGNQYRNYVSDLVGTTGVATNNAGVSSSTPSFLNENPNFYFYPLYHNNTDWSDGIYQSAFTQNYKVNVQGGDNVAMYNLSLGFTQSDATAKTNDYNRLNIRFNTDIQLIDNLSTQLDIAYGRQYYNLRNNGWAEDYSEGTISSPNVLGVLQAPFLSQYGYYTGSDLKLHRSSVYAGKYAVENPYNQLTNPFSFANAYGATSLANPHWILLNGDGAEKNNQELTQFNLNVNPRYQITKNFYINNRFSYLMNRSGERAYLPKAGVTPYELEGLGRAYSAIRTKFGKEESIYEDFRLNWGNSYGAHKVSAFGGMRLTSFSYSDSYIGAFNIDNDKMPNLSNDRQFKSYGGTNDNWTNLSYYAHADYNYMNKYFIQGAISMETSSRFGTQTKEGIQLGGVSWGLFPSLQAAWVISSEPWFKNVRGVDYLKLAAGIERVGNDDVDYHAARTYYRSYSFLKTATGLQLDNIENPAIQWETTDKFNIGLTASILKNRINIGLEYFNNRTSNLLSERTISYLTGLKSYWSNDGALKNEGVDLNLNAVVINTKDWKWQVGASMGHYVNRMTKVSASDRINLYTDYTNTTIAKTIEGYTSPVYGGETLVAKGQSIGSFYGYEFAGVFSTDAEAKAAGRNGDYLKYATGLSATPFRDFKAGDAKFVDKNGDGVIDANDKVVIGNANPDIYGNIYTALSWKRFTLDVNFKYSLGNDVYNYQRSQIESASTFYNQSLAVVNRWSYEGQVTDVPRLNSTESTSYVANERFSSRWIEDGSYLKLKKLRLTYRLPISNLWLQGLSVWGEGNNLAVFSKYLGADPEVTVNNSVLYQGIDAGLLPLSRSFNLGVTINL